MKWEAEADTGDMEVFPRFHAVPFSKMLTFYRRDNFVVEGCYDGSAPIPDQHIGNFEVGEVKPLEDGGNQKVKVKVRVNLNGIFTIASASLVEKYEVEEEVPMEVDSKEGEGKKEADEKKEEPMEEGGEKKEEKKEVKMEKRKKTVTKNIDLPITPRCVGALSREKLEKAIDLERSFVAQDQLECERLNVKNSVEEYIYDIRSKIFEELADFITEDDRSAFSRELEDAENWLYEDGEDAEKAVYAEKLKALKLKGEPVRKRYQEFEQRPAAIEALGRSLQLASKALDAYKAGEEKYAHLDAAEMDKVAKQIAEKRAWMDESIAALNQTAKTVNPGVLAVQFLNEKSGFESIVTPILNKPKPKVEPPKEEEKKENGDAPAKEGEVPAAGEKAAEQKVNGAEMEVD